MNFSTRGRKRQAGFDMTPMIDVVLQLIIFFLYTAHFSSLTRSPVDLPKERGEEAISVGAGAIVVDLLSDGRVMVEREEVDLAAIVSKVEFEIARIGSAEGVEVLVRADRSIPAESVNDLARQLSALGVRNWRLGTADQGG